MEPEKHFRITPTQAAPDPDTMLDALVQAGYSNTRSRRAVLEALCEAGGQADPIDLLTRGRIRHPALGLVTVYRTLDVLLTLGLVRKLHREEGCHSYAPATHDHGHHVICQRCQRAVEFEGCDLDAVISAVVAQTGFHIQSHWLEMFGVCPECQAAG
jgi:Fur family transcriptional regulator, ferric uptake regulator